MKLEEIGFYTLCDQRAREASEKTRLYRVEILLTGRCNFSCPYCRHVGGPDIERDLALSMISLCAEHNLFGLRLSGGEPTVHPDVVDMVKLSQDLGIEKIALSTNGSANVKLYESLIDSGANDFSISLDACCAADAEQMTGGGISGMWEEFLENVRYISSRTYVTVGVVLNEDNKDKANDIILFADSLGVSDIRVIPAAQDTSVLSNIQVEQRLLDKYPILKYRHNNLVIKRPVRGLTEKDSKCPLVLDDMAIMGNKHYPCIIYMREGGSPIGTVGKNMRAERKEWFETQNVFKNDICQRNCLDVCVDYNRRWIEFH